MESTVNVCIIPKERDMFVAIFPDSNAIKYSCIRVEPTYLIPLLAALNVNDVTIKTPDSNWGYK